MKDWSPQQTNALEKVADWHKNSNAQVFRVFGYAGTGKTTLARHFASEIEGKVLFAAYTGKAAIVMRKSGCRGASTIHSLIYETIEDEITGDISFELNENGPIKNAELIIIDECSMVDEGIGRDLLSFGVPVLVLGDPAQLPPVKGGGYFTNHEPDIMLTEIHRQAEGNPIVKLATDVREGRSLDYGQYGESLVIHKSEINSSMVLGADQVLVGKNVTRSMYNARIRELIGYENVFPVIGDRLVCLKNDHTAKIFNGGLFSVTSVKTHMKTVYPGFITLTISSEDFPGRKEVEVRVKEEFFMGNIDKVDWRELRGTQHFDYGYALTVHKSQGSQWPDVMLFDESRAFRDDWQRWLYTGITRASERITIVR
ncbi:MAG: ATP-binding protein [Robiginitomaculum sp.]|nr:MAG: ATP-binding protein [Robiginitomaculum sp.]